jgi:predicted membrane protein
VIGPGWVRTGLAIVMLAIGASCVFRLAMWRLRRHNADPEADALHVLMGTSMAGMLDARLSLASPTAWIVVFAGATSWFAWHAIRGRMTPKHRKWECAHPAPHAVESAAMLYMLWPTQPLGHSPVMSMPGMTSHAPNPALALVLALFMAGYMLWTTDQLATRSRTRKTEAFASTAPLPRLATCSKIVMSAAMGYMLLSML